MIAGGAHSMVHLFGITGFIRLTALSPNNEDPTHASRPFDMERNGFVVGEGAGILFIETLESAQERGATIYAELVGYASTDDAFHITAPEEDGAGMTQCMRLALDAAGLTPDRIDYINAHGTSTPLNDVTETRAILP